MRSLLTLSAFAVLSATLNAVAGESDRLTAGPTAAPVTEWPKPFVLPIKLPPTNQSPEWTQLSFVAGKGFVAGTPEAILSIGQPLAGLPGQGRTLAVCKKAVWKSAVKVGADGIEALSQAPDRRVSSGQIFAPVTMRISYTRQNIVEVKKSTVICVVNKAGRFVDAYVPEDIFLAAQIRPQSSSVRWSSLTYSSKLLTSN